MNIVIRQFQDSPLGSPSELSRFTVLPILDPFLTISIYLFSAAVATWPGDWNFFREGNPARPNLANAGVPPRVNRQKIFLSAVERIFTDQPCPIVPATF